MRLGLGLRNTGPRAIANVRELPQIAEAAGIDSVWFIDHLVGVPDMTEAYGAMWAEGLTSMAYAAAQTERIRLGIGVLVLPYRDPVHAARILTTIDHLSDGRLDVGLGVGYARGEFEAIGRRALFGVRGRVADEAIEIMLRCWRGGTFSWAGEFHQFRDLTFEPAPLQSPHPPLWVGGNTGPALRRAARVADVWHATRLTPEELRERGDQLDVVAGRKIPRTVRLRFYEDASADSIFTQLTEYQRVGCAEVVVEIASDDRTFLVNRIEALGRFARSTRSNRVIEPVSAQSEIEVTP